MPFPSALSSPNLTTLRATRHAANEYLLLGSNTTVLAARVNQTVFANSFASLTFDTVTTGAYTDVKADMTVLISATNDKRAAYFIGRVRADNSGVVSTATVLNINETSATISDNDYLFVLNDYRLFHELGRYDGTTYTKDYALTFTALKPVIYGLQSAYAGIVSGSPVGFAVSFAAQAFAAASGATISSYAWTIPSGGTVTAGATNTANVTVRFDASAAEYWVRLVVTDSGGRTRTRYIPVFAIPANLSTTVYLGVNGPTITGDIENGYNASVDAFSGLSSVLDNTLAVILDVEYYGTTETSLFSTVKFIGRLRKDDNATKPSEQISISRKASVEIEGAAAQMSRITTPQITARDSSSASVWDEITKLTAWRATVYLLEHSTFHSLYSLSFDSTADTYLAYQLLAAQGNMLSGVNDILKSINAALEFAPTGEVRGVRNLNFLSDAERLALTTVADFTSQDWIGFSLPHEHVLTIGIVEGSGGTYYRDGGISPSTVVAQLSIAPGIAQGNAEGVSPLPGQVLTANVAASVSQDELNTRTGDHFAFVNGSDELNVDLRTGYNWIVPSRYQYYTWTIAAGDNTFGRAYTTADKWWCKSVNIRHDNLTGKKEVSAVFVLETRGTDVGATGQTVTPQAPGEVAPYIPAIPVIPAYPNFPPLPGIYLPANPTPGQTPPYQAPSIAPDGNWDVVFNDRAVWVTRNFIGVPIWVEITPPDLLGTVRDAALVGQSVYVVSSDGTNSTVYYRSNAWGTGITWTNSGSISGVYGLIVPTSTAGSVYIEGAVPASAVPCTDFAIGNISGFTAFGNYLGEFDGKQRYETEFHSGDNVYYLTLITPDADTCCLVNSITVVSGSIGGNRNLIICGNPQTLASFDTLTDPVGHSLNYLAYASGTAFTLDIDFSATGGGSLYVTAFSNDYGVTFASPVTVDTTGGGMDTIKIGVPVLVGGASQVRIATSAGGAYSDYGSAMPAGSTPTAIVIPRKTFTGGNNVSTNTPQYIVASSTASSGASLWKVSSSGTVFTDITKTIGGFPGLATGPKCIATSWWSHLYIAAILSYNGTPKLIVSVNGGTSFTDYGVIDDDSVQLTFRRGDRSSVQLFLTDGSPAYSRNRGVAIVSKNFPDDAAVHPILGVLPYG